MGLKTVSALLALCASFASAVKPLKVEGSNFINTATNQRFEIIGVAYQPGGSAGFIPGKGDPLSDGTICLRDAAVMQSLGVNTIRVYNLDPTLNHDDCASIFNGVGIYMIIDVNSPLPGEALSAGNPSGAYHASYLKRVFSVIEAFKGYDNLIGFFSGNEVINDDNTGHIDPPYIRAVTRDMKNYIAKHSSRAIPVGYSAADYRDNIFDQWQYLQCAQKGDQNDPSKIDFFGLNSYSWCGESSYTTAGYDVLTTAFSNTAIPIFFSEYGCNQPSPRIFTEVQALYGPNMRAVLSGGLVYEYTQGENNYGIVSVNANQTATLLSDFGNLQAQFNKIDLSAINAVNATATSQSAPSCDVGLIKNSAFSREFNIPSVPAGVQDLIDNGVTGITAGKLVQVKQTAVQMAVYDTAGQPLQNLAIKLLSDDGTNAPSGQNTNSGAPAAASGAGPSSSGSMGSTTTAPAPAATTSVKSGTSRVRLGGAETLLALAAFGVFCVL